MPILFRLNSIFPREIIAAHLKQNGKNDDKRVAHSERYVNDSEAQTYVRLHKKHVMNKI